MAYVLHSQGAGLFRFDSSNGFAGSRSAQTALMFGTRTSKVANMTAAIPSFRD